MLGGSETERRKEERVNYMKSGKLNPSSRLGLIFCIAVSLLCGTITENALGQGPLGVPLDPNGPPWVPKVGEPTRSGEFLPPSGPGSKGPPKCVPGILGQCQDAIDIDPQTPGIDQTFTAMFQGQCNLARESCVSLRSSCTEGSGNPLRRSFNMILNKETGYWCLVDPQNGTSKCLEPRGHKQPSSNDLCLFLVPAVKLNPIHAQNCKCKLIGGIPKVGQVIVPETASYACAQNMKTLSECNTCCSTAGTGFFQDDTARAKWLTDCQGSCKNYRQG